MELKEILLWICFASGIVGAAILSRSNRAGTGCLLGLLGPIGPLIAFRMRGVARAAEVTPTSPECGAQIRLYKPLPRSAALVGSVFVFAFSAGVGKLAYHYDGTWVGWVAGPFFVASALLGVNLLQNAALPYPLVGVFEKRILLGRTFFRWPEIQAIDHSTSELRNHELGTAEHLNDWIFHKSDGKKERLSVPSGEYIDINEFNEILQRKSNLRLQKHL